MPADCVILDEMNLEVDESIYGKDRSNVKKEESQYFGNNLQDRDINDDEIDNHKSNPDFILLSDSKVMKGEGRAIVCAVGKFTYLARKRTKQSLMMEEEKTLLEQKLEQLSEVVSKWINLVVLLIIVTLGTYNTLHFIFSSEKTPFSDAFLMTSVRIIIMGLCLLIVAIPEGMPLAVSIAMSMQVQEMKKDKVLIKNIESVQVCALLHEICVGKTGTLTKSEMHVKSYQLLNDKTVHENKFDDPKYMAHFNSRMKVVRNMDLSNDAVAKANDNIKGLIREAILANTDVHLEVDEGQNKETASYVAKGQALEVAMINFLMENGEDVYNLFNSQNQHQEKIFQLPFDQDLKRKTVVRVDGANEEMCRVYVKGAPEEIIQICTQTLDGEVNPREFTAREQNSVLNIID